MNWKHDQIEKLILFYSHKFTIVCFWYQKSCNWYQILHGTSFLVPVSGQYVMGITDKSTLLWLRPVFISILVAVNRPTSNSINVASPSAKRLKS